MSVYAEFQAAYIREVRFHSSIFIQEIIAIYFQKLPPSLSQQPLITSISECHHWESHPRVPLPSNFQLFSISHSKVIQAKISTHFPKFVPSIISLADVRIEFNLLHQMQNVETHIPHSNLSNSASKTWVLWNNQIH